MLRRVKQYQLHLLISAITNSYERGRRFGLPRRTNVGRRRDALKFATLYPSRAMTVAPPGKREQRRLRAWIPHELPKGLDE